MLRTDGTLRRIADLPHATEGFYGPPASQRKLPTFQADGLSNAAEGFFDRPAERQSLSGRAARYWQDRREARREATTHEPEVDRALEE